MINVFFGTASGSSMDIVAKFEDDEIYNACLPSLERLARRDKLVVIESVVEDKSLEE